MCSNSSLKSLSKLKTKFTWDHHGIGEKIYSNDSGQLSFFILILSAPGGGGAGAGAFSGDFTTNLARQCRAFSRALKIEKLKAPLFRGPEGTGATNDWCIKHGKCIFVLRSESPKYDTQKVGLKSRKVYIDTHLRLSSLTPMHRF